MAAQRRALRLSKRAALWLLAGLASLVSAYLLAAWIGSSIPRNGRWREPDAGVTIMVETNGLHTGIVVPIVTDVFDWRTVFPSAAEPLASGEAPTHIAIDWGEREVFLNTPTWAELDPGTALRVLLTGGEPIIRVNHYLRPAPSAFHRPLRLRFEEYRRLVASVRRSLPPVPPGGERRTYPSFQRGTRNYASLGRYTVFNTCNNWTADRLADAGVRTGWWTPLAGGVMKWVPRPSPLSR